MNHFVYLTTNLVNGKQYVGDHSSDNLNDGYLGSGTAIIRAIKKYRKNNFRREILEEFGSKKDAFNSQEKYIKKFDTLVPNGYNISPSGGVHWGGVHSDQTKKQISESQKNMPEERKKRMSEIHKGMKHSESTIIKMKNKVFSKEYRKKLSNANSERIWTEESKEKNRQSHIGKKHTNETKRKMSESHKGLKPSKESIRKRVNKMKGRKLSLEHKLKIIEKKKLEQKYVCEYCGLKTNKGNYKRWHGKKCKHRF